MGNFAGYLQGNLEHHLDHLAPFCSLMGWPLIVTDGEIYKLGKLYYPDLSLIFLNPLEAPFETAKQFDTIVTTLPRASFDEIFLIAELSLRKRLKTYWLPHGNSDKGHLLPWMEALSREEAAFVYGQKMIDFLAQKNVKIPTLIPVGNFRYLYYKKHQQFYSNLLDSMGLNKSFVLYAPTWNDAEGSCSFETAIDQVLEKYSNSSLVIKPHPNELENIHVIQRKLMTKNVIWLDHFPPIYPLLERTTHLLGDFSSIGYDFLRFNRPMTFFNPTHRPLTDPGRILHRENSHELATYTFGNESTWPQLLEKVKQLDNS